MTACFHWMLSTLHVCSKHLFKKSSLSSLRRVSTRDKNLEIMSYEEGTADIESAAPGSVQS